MNIVFHYVRSKQTKGTQDRQIGLWRYVYETIPIIYNYLIFEFASKQPHAQYC